MDSAPGDRPQMVVANAARLRANFRKRSYVPKNQDRFYNAECLQDQKKS